MDYLALTIGGSIITIPDSVPHGGLSYLEILISNAMLVFLFFGVCLVVIYIAWGGLQWARSEGDKQKLTAAKGKVTWAIIGLILLFLSYAFISAVGFLFKIDLLKLAPF